MSGRKLTAKITGVGKALPEKRLTNADLEKMVETTDAWITQRVKDVARGFSKGRIVSCLEGGYVMGPLARSVEAHLRVLADL